MYTYGLTFYLHFNLAASQFIHLTLIDWSFGCLFFLSIIIGSQLVKCINWEATRLKCRVQVGIIMCVVFLSSIYLLLLLAWYYALAYSKSFLAAPDIRFFNCQIWLQLLVFLSRVFFAVKMFLDGWMDACIQTTIHTLFGKQFQKTGYMLV